jgi:selenocysteine lyase/cysteine desulfurase
MNSRKQFIKNSGLALAGFLLPHVSIANTQGTVGLDDVIGSDFNLDENIIFLNNGTMGPSPKPVVAAMIEGLEDVTKHGLYGRRKSEAIDNLAAFIGCTRDEVALTNNVTHGINIMAWGVPLKPGDEIILTTQEHVGNATPWLYRAQQEHLIIKSIPLGNTAQETLDIIKKAISPKTKVLALPHIPCTNGQVLPLKEICTLAKLKNITTCIDGAHGTGMLPINVKEIGCDYYASCGHKWLLAAQGTGYIYINKDKLAKLLPKFYGAEGTVEFNTIDKIPFLKTKTDSAQRFMYGTQSGALWNSVTAAIQFQNGIGREAILKHIQELSLHLHKGLQEFKKHVDILTPEEAKSRAGIIAFKFKTKDTKLFFDKLSSKNIITRYVAENKINCLRISMHIYNSQAQLDKLLSEVKAFV